MSTAKWQNIAGSKKLFSAECPLPFPKDAKNGRKSPKKMNKN